MKKALLFIAITLPLLFTSCSSDEEKNSNPLVGTWEKVTNFDPEEITFNNNLTVIKSTTDKDSKAVTELSGTYIVKDDNIVVIKWMLERKQNPVTKEWSNPATKESEMVISYSVNRSNFLYFKYGIPGQLQEDTYTRK